MYGNFKIELNWISKTVGGDLDFKFPKNDHFPEIAFKVLAHTVLSPVFSRFQNSISKFDNQKILFLAGINSG